MKTFFPVVAGLAFLSTALGHPTPSSYGALPLSFEPNRGQADAGAAFVARGAGYFLSIDPLGTRMVLRGANGSTDLRVRLAGAQPASLQAEAPLPSYSSYFRGPAEHWLTGIPNYSRVLAREVYPGIDLVYYGNQSHLEYDFTIAPGADPDRIRMHLEGTRNLSVAADGGLRILTASGELTEHPPVVYQEFAGVRHAVPCNFFVKGSDVAFRVGGYDRSKPLVIDPVLVYSSFLGGSDTDEGHAVAADASGALYMTGVTYSTPNGDGDVLLRKISPDGTAFVYNADLGGNNDDVANGIAVDATGSVYVAGRTSSDQEFPISAGAFQAQLNGDTNAFLLRLDPTATNVVFSTYIGGSDDDEGYAMTIDSTGGAYLTGVASSPDFPVSGGAFQTTLRGNSNAFIFKTDSQGNAQFSTFIGGRSDDEAFGIAVDANGNSYITGQTDSDSFPQANAPFQHSRHGGLDAFITELSADGSSLIFSTFVGGSNDDSGQSIALDRSGNIVIAGTTASTDLPTSSGTWSKDYLGGNSDIFVVKYLPNGSNIAWGTYLGSHGTDDGNAITVDANGNIYIAGDTNSSQYPVTRDGLQQARGGAYDAVLSVLDPNGAQLYYSSFLGGSGDDSAFAVALDPSYNVYLTGMTSSNNFPVTAGAVQPTPGGGSADAFLTKVYLAGSSIPGAPPSAGAFSQTSSLPQPDRGPMASNFGRGMVAPRAAGEFRRDASRLAVHSARRSVRRSVGTGNPELPPQVQR